MKKMGKKLIAGTAMALTAASMAGCGIGPAPEAVYGPPEYFEQETATPEMPEPESETTEAETTYDPNKDVPEGVYGPPSSFNPSAEIPEDVYGPPSYFEN